MVLPDKNGQPLCWALLDTLDQTPVSDDPKRRKDDKGTALIMAGLMREIISAFPAANHFFNSHPERWNVWFEIPYGPSVSVFITALRLRKTGGIRLAAYFTDTLATDCRARRIIDSYVRDASETAARNLTNKLEELAERPTAYLPSCSVTFRHVKAWGESPKARKVRS